MLDLSKDPPVVEGDDGLMEGVEVSGVAPEVGMEPVREGFEGLFIQGRCSEQVDDMSIMLTSCHSAKSHHSSIIQLLDEDSRMVPIWTRDSK